MTDAASPVQTRWHLIVGTVGGLYALAGLVAWSFALIGTLFWKQFMEMAGMSNASMPPALRNAALAQSVIFLGLGVLLLIGSILVLMRRSRGASLMRTWAVLRLVCIVVGVALALALMQPQIDFQMSMLEAQRSMMRERGTPEDKLPVVDRPATERWQRMSMAGMTIVTAAFPLFVGLLFTSKKKKEEIAQWDATRLARV